MEDSLDSEEIAMEVAMEDSEMVPDSETKDSMEVAAEDVLPESEKIAATEIAVPDSEEVATNDAVPDSEEVVPDSGEVMSDSVDVVPDSVEMVQCPHCGTFHAGGVFGDACFQARRCARCGLLHEDYDLPSRWFHGMEKFDCEVFVPDVEKLQMNGNTIILPEQVIKKLEEHVEKMKHTKTSPEANRNDKANIDQ